MRHLPALLAGALALLPGWRTGNTERARDAATAAPPRISATAGAFSGRFKLTLAPSPSCSMTLRSVTGLVFVTEDPVHPPTSPAAPIAPRSEHLGPAAGT